MTGERGVAVGQQVSDPPPLDIKHLCFSHAPEGLGRHGVQSAPYRAGGLSPPAYGQAGRAFLTIVHAHSTRSVCECGACGALMFSHAPEGPGEHGAR